MNKKIILALLLGLIALPTYANQRANEDINIVNHFNKMLILETNQLQGLSEKTEVPSYFADGTKQDPSVNRGSLDPTNLMDSLSGRYSFYCAPSEYRNRADFVQDIQDYIDEKTEYEISGNLSDYERKRNILKNEYLRESRWLTGQGYTEFDAELRRVLKTIFGGLLEYVCELLGLDGLKDDVLQGRMTEEDTNDFIQEVEKSAVSALEDLFTANNQSTDTLYTKIQNNAFELLELDHRDFCRVVKEYPEVGFLFDDMYIFFQWRYSLRTYKPIYKNNENNIDATMRPSAHQSSFLAWWELASRAKESFRQTVQEDAENLTMKEIRWEDLRADNKDILKYGRYWNGIQHYAVLKHALPVQLKPKESVGGKFSIGIPIIRKYRKLPPAQILEDLTKIRASYVSARIQGAEAWKQDLSDYENQFRALQALLQEHIKKNASIDKFDTNDQKSQEILEQQVQEEVEEVLQSLGLPADLKEMQGQQLKRELIRQLQQGNLI